MTFENYSGHGGRRVWLRQRSLVLLFALGGHSYPRIPLPASTPRLTRRKRRSTRLRVYHEAIIRARYWYPAWRRLAFCSQCGGLGRPQPAGSPLRTRVKKDLPRDHEWRVPRPLVFRHLVAADCSGSNTFAAWATVTSASRMAFAFARDGGLPFFTHGTLGLPEKGRLRRLSGDLVWSRRPRLALHDPRPRCTRRSPPFAPFFSTFRTWCQRHRSTGHTAERGRQWAPGTWDAGIARWPCSV